MYDTVDSFPSFIPLHFVPSLDIVFVCCEHDPVLEPFYSIWKFRSASQIFRVREINFDFDSMSVRLKTL